MKRRQLDNKKKIIKTLSNKELRFEELLGKVDVSRATLNSHLKQLVDEGGINKQYSLSKKAIVYTVPPETVIREIIIHDFVNFVGSNTVAQILEIEMGLRTEIDLREAFPYGTVEDFFQKYKTKLVSYRDVLNILKEEYGGWIEKESKEDDTW